MYEFTGKVKTVGELQTFASGFTKRELVVEKAAEQKSKLWTVRSGVETPEGVERFVAAQEGVWEIVLPELRETCSRTFSMPFTAENHVPGRCRFWTV